jgi:hypothetical protein
MTRTYVAAAVLAASSMLLPVQAQAESQSELMSRGYTCRIVAAGDEECSKPGFQTWTCTAGTCKQQMITSRRGARIFSEAIAEMMTY